MEKAKFTIEGYGLKQLKMDGQGHLSMTVEGWENKTVAIIVLDEPVIN